MIFPLFLSALLLYLSFPNVLSLVGFPVFGWFFAVPLFWLLEKKTALQRAVLGFAWGMLAYGITSNWFLEYSAWGFLFFVLALSGQPAVFGALYNSPSKNRARDVLYTASLWIVSEFLRGLWTRGLSWDVGHSQVSNPVFLQFADFLGSPGLSFLLLAVNYALYRWLKSPGEWKIWGAITAGVFAGLLVYGTSALHKSFKPQQSFSVCMVQPSIDFRRRGQADDVAAVVTETLEFSKQCFSERLPDVVVWPETAVPLDFRAEPAILQQLQDFVRQSAVPLILGAVTREAEKNYNSVMWLGADGTVKELYRKRFLVPITEYFPAGVLGDFAARRLQADHDLFSPGQSSEAVRFFAGQPYPIGLLICSEDLLAGTFRDYARRKIGLILVLLNDGWLSQKSGLAIHRQQAVMHAVENRLPVLRVGNTGLSGFIEPTGRIIDAGLKPQHPGARTVQIYFAANSTAYRILIYPFYFFCLGFVIINFVLVRRRK